MSFCYLTCIFSITFYLHYCLTPCQYSQIYLVFSLLCCSPSVVFSFTFPFAVTFCLTFCSCLLSGLVCCVVPFSLIIILTGHSLSFLLLTCHSSSLLPYTINLSYFFSIQLFSFPFLFSFTCKLIFYLLPAFVLALLNILLLPDCFYPLPPDCPSTFPLALVCHFPSFALYFLPCLCFISFLLSWAQLCCVFGVLLCHLPC